MRKHASARVSDTKDLIQICKKVDENIKDQTIVDLRDTLSKERAARAAERAAYKRREKMIYTVISVILLSLMSIVFASKLPSWTAFIPVVLTTLVLTCFWRK